MKAKLKIEQGIPVSPKGRRGQFTEILSKMQDGDSFKVDDRRDQCTVLTAAKRLGYKITSRKVNGDGWRIWLVKKP